jgi:hypothetical protein
LEIRRITSLFVLSAAVIAIMPALGADIAVAQSRASGGFIDSATGAGMRPRLSAGEIQSFMPQRGTFTFPAPYGTTGVRLTNGSDCGGGDCVNYVGYSYWRNINNHVGSDTMLIVLGLDRQRRADAIRLRQEQRPGTEPRSAVPGGQPLLLGIGRGLVFQRQPAQLALYE